MKGKLFWTEFFDCTSRHGGHVVEGTKAFIQNVSYTFYFFGTIRAVLSLECNQRIVSNSFVSKMKNKLFITAC